MTIKHRKHIQLSRPQLDQYSRLDISWLGAPCNMINHWMEKISKKISNSRLLLVDADHHTNSIGSTLQVNECIMKDAQFTENDFDSKIMGLAYDTAFINGNHYSGKRQIVFLHPEKRKSVQKRIKQITQPLCYISVEKEAVFDFLPLQSADGMKIPVFQIQQEKEVFDFIQKEINDAAPKLKGLILAGGKSSRMGQDKSRLSVAGEIQQERLEKLLISNGLNIYISRAKHDDNSNTIRDTFLNMGPLGAICSAFQTDPNAAYLVLACDLMLLDHETLKQLIKKRNVAKFATCFQGPNNEFPDPLLTIYEPKAYKRLLEFLALGYTCPRKMLINSDCEIIKLKDSTPLTNVNTPEEYNDIIKQLG